MIPLQISAQEYVKYFHPTPDYIFAVRRLENYDKLGMITIPDEIKRAGVKFLSIAELLAVSRYPSENPWIEGMKEVLRTKKYIGFEFHVVANVTLPPQFEFPKGDNVVMLHVKDITIILEDNCLELYEKQRKWEEAENKRIEKSLAEARKSILKG